MMYVLDLCKKEIGFTSCGTFTDTHVFQIDKNASENDGLNGRR